jgi:hypothetical protein
MVELIIYTSQGAITYAVKKTVDNFVEVLTKALESGYVSVETVEGSNLVINPLNVAAIEIREISTDDEQ